MKIDFFNRWHVGKSEGNCPFFTVFLDFEENRLVRAIESWYHNFFVNPEKSYKGRYKSWRSTFTACSMWERTKEIALFLRFFLENWLVFAIESRHQKFLKIIRKISYLWIDFLCHWRDVRKNQESFFKKLKLRFLIF